MMIRGFCPKTNACPTTNKLKERHDEVVRHEQAHYDAAGDLALSGPVLSDWVEGPDGERYATGGHVQINTSETGDPEEDLRRGEIIVKAAEAPLSVNSDLSDADINVASKGRQMISKNRPKLAQLDKLKTAFKGLGSHLNQQQMSDITANMGLDLKPGKILSSLA